MRCFQLAGSVLALALAAIVNADCESYGVDFQDKGSYFQNSLSTDPFTALQQFSGCNNDVSYNILVDPDGDQSQCSNTPLQPDNTPQIVNCTDSPKNTLYTGDWSILVISNNGDDPDDQPLAAQRDFYLTVAPQQTVTSVTSSTVTATSISTPVVNVTATSTSTATVSVINQVTLKASTSTTTTTKALFTWTRYTWTKSIATATTTVVATCIPPTVRPVLDPIAYLKPTILGPLDQVAASVIQSAASQIACNVFGCKRDAAPAPTAAPELSGSAKFKRDILAGRAPSDDDRRKFIAERHSRLHGANPTIVKRFPDSPTITATSTSLVITTIDSTAPTATATLTSVVTTTSTTQVYQTMQAPPVTITKTRWVAITAFTKTETLSATITSRVTTTASGAVSSCAAKGGHLTYR